MYKYISLPLNNTFPCVIGKFSFTKAIAICLLVSSLCCEKLQNSVNMSGLTHAEQLLV